MRVSSLPSLLSSLSSSHNTSHLLKLLLSTLIRAHFEGFIGNRGDNAAMEMVLSVLDEVPLGNEVVMPLIRFVCVCTCVC